jgi:hypothetical protein
MEDRGLIVACDVRPRLSRCFDTVRLSGRETFASLSTPGALPFSLPIVCSWMRVLGLGTVSAADIRWRRSQGDL